MKHRKKIIGVIATVMLLASLAVMPVAAQAPPLPCAFSGSVTLDGAACPGSTVTVQLTDGTPVTTMPAAVTVTAGSTYALVIAQDSTTGLPAEGAALNFYVDGNLATTSGDTATWEAGGMKTVNLAAVSGAPPPTYYTLTIAVSPPGGGTTSPAAGTHSYPAGTPVTITATAAAGYTFSHWGGDASGTSSSTTVTMNSNKSVTAYFTAVGVYPTFADWIYDTFIA